MSNFEGTITITLNPVREAISEEEFIQNLLSEYNDKCGELFRIARSDITNIEVANAES